MEVKNFVIFAADHFGDTLVLGELIYNIRHFFKPVNICLVVYPQWEYIAKLMFGIDKIVVLRKNDYHKGLKGALNLKKDIGYKTIYASIITFRRQRPIFIANLLNSKYILFHDINPFFNIVLRRKKYSIFDNPNIHISSNITNLLCGIIQEKFIHIPIKLNINKIKKQNTNYDITNYIAINPIGIGDYKCLGINQLIDIINVFNDCGKKVLILGNGEKAIQYSDALHKSNIACLNLINKTSIKDLVDILTKVQAVITVDTGTAHLSTYLGQKTLWLSAKSQWIPDEIYENAINLPLSGQPQDIFNAVNVEFLN